MCQISLYCDLLRATVIMHGIDERVTLIVNCTSKYEKRKMFIVFEGMEISFYRLFSTINGGNRAPIWAFHELHPSQSMKKTSY